jgi:hypothetical protein
MCLEVLNKELTLVSVAPPEAAKALIFFVSAVVDWLP